MSAQAKKFEILQNGLEGSFGNLTLFISMRDGVILRDNSQFPERAGLDRGNPRDRLKRIGIDLLIFPLILLRDFGKGIAHFFKPYENKEKAKKDALFFKDKILALLRNLGGNTLMAIIMGFSPLILLIGSLAYALRSNNQSRGVKAASIIFFTFLMPFILAAVGLGMAYGLIRAVVPLVLSPLAYLLGMPLRGLMTLVRKVFPSAPIEEGKAFQNKVAEANKLLPKLSESDQEEQSYVMTGKDAATLITLARELHAQFKYYLEAKQRRTLIEPDVERDVFQQILDAYPPALLQQLKTVNYTQFATPVSVPGKMLVAMKQYFDLFASESVSKAMVDKHSSHHVWFMHMLKARATEKKTSALLSPLPLQVLEDAVSPHALGSSAEMKRQAFLDRIATKDFGLIDESEQVTISAVDRRKIVVPRAVAQIQRRLMMVEKPEEALEYARGHKEYARFFQRVVPVAPQQQPHIPVAPTPPTA